MRVISFRDTVLYKRGFWLSGAALVAAVAAPSVVDGSIFVQPVLHIAPVCILIAFLVYFLQRARFFTIADEVVDRGDHLTVRRGSAVLNIPLSSIASAEVRSDFRMLRVCLHLQERTPLGARVDFWPQASLWGNAPAVQRLAADLAERRRGRTQGRDMAIDPN